VTLPPSPFTFMSMKLSKCLTLVFLLEAALVAHGKEEACEEPVSQNGSALLQIHGGKVEAKRTCSWHLQKNEDGSQPCRQNPGGASGAVASLDEAGYQQAADLCCHHEMSLFVRREIQRQGLDVCDLSDLHGFVHWYDCTDDRPKTFAEMTAEIAGVPSSPCPWLGNNDNRYDNNNINNNIAMIGNLPNCPVKGPNCRDFPPCPADFPPNSLPGATASLDDSGYAAVALRCCHVEMEQYVRRIMDRLNFNLCEEGSLQGFLHWFDCPDDGQTLAKIEEGLRMGRSGLPPLCPWLGGVGEPCPARGHNCPFVEVAEPAAHRRRTACR